MNYSDEMLDHLANPRNVGSLDKNSPRVGTGVASEGKCGDVVQLQIEVDDDGRVANARFRTFGCGAAIACSSWTAQWVEGKSVEQAQELKSSLLVRELSLPEPKFHCGVAAENALRAAIDDWKQKNARPQVRQASEDPSG